MNVGSRRHWLAAAVAAIISAMAGVVAREPVRLGKHLGKPVFDEFKGLHDDAFGLTAIAGGSVDDPYLIFEEHGTGTLCRYFDLRPDGLLTPGLKPQLHDARLRAMVGSQDMREHWFAIRNIFAKEDPAYVNQVISDLRAATTSGGQAPLVAVSRRFQRRMTAVRLLAVAQSHPDLPLQEILSQRRSLQHHTAGIFPTWVYEPLVLLGSPFARGFVAGRGIDLTNGNVETALLVSLGGTRECVPLHADEVTWPQVYEAELPTLRELPRDGTTWMRHANHGALIIDAAALLRWWTESLNRLFTELTDLGRHRDQDGLLDAGRADRTFRTLERVIANCIRIQARPIDHLTRVALAYELFDLLPNLLDRELNPPHVWERLANPDNARNILSDAFAQVPDVIRKYLKRRTTTVLTKLREETVEHLVYGRSDSKRITVGDTQYPQGAFIAELLHQLRNTHHGYELDEPGKRAVLAAHTGHVSEAFPELVVLYTVAVITDPRRALDGDWF